MRIHARSRTARTAGGSCRVAAWCASDPSAIRPLAARPCDVHVRACEMRGSPRRAPNRRGARNHPDSSCATEALARGHAGNPATSKGKERTKAAGTVNGAGDKDLIPDGIARRTCVAHRAEEQGKERAWVRRRTRVAECARSCTAHARAALGQRRSVASRLESAAGSIGLTMWASNPASAVRRRSSSCPQPVSAISVSRSPPGRSRIRRQAS